MRPLPSFLRSCLTPRLVALLVWLLAVGVSIAWFSKYQTTAGATGTAPAYWPNETKLPRNQLGPTVLLFLHPQCVCSKASVRQLFDFTKSMESLEMVTVLVLPESTDEAFARGPVMTLLEQEYQHWPILDVDGKEAARFGVQTSGQAFAYDRDGQLLFSGGLTLMRGHTGYSPGVLALLQALRDSRLDSTCYPVFGCPLQNPLHQGEK